MHAVRGEIKRRNRGSGFNHARDRVEVRSVQKRDRRIGQRDEFRLKSESSIHNVINELFVVSHDGVDLCETRDEYQAVMIIPSGFVMRVVGGIAPGRIMNHDHASKLKESRANTGNVTGITRDNAISSFHMQLLHPNPLRGTMSRVSFG